MENVRVSQIGQVAVNRPLFEFRIGPKAYILGLDADNRLRFRNRKFLQAIGLFSCVACTFQDGPDADFTKLFAVATDGSIAYQQRFSYARLGSSLAFVDDFRPESGWASATPSNRVIINF